MSKYFSKTKKLLVLLTVIISMAVFSSCGGNEAVPESAAENGAAQESTDESAAAQESTNYREEKQ